MSKLPSGWADCSLEDLLGTLEDGRILQQGWSPQCENTPAVEGEWGVLKTTAVQDGYFIEVENKKLPSKLDPKPEIEVKAGDLLMTCAGPRSRCGVVCHVEKTREKLIFSGKIYRFRPNHHYVATKFLAYLLRTPELKDKINDIKTGISDSGMNMTRDRFFSLNVTLAPLGEQFRIVKKLDELLSHVDAIKTRMDTIPVLINRFRQSVLAAATNGKLTEDWRNARGLLPDRSEVVFSDLLETFRGGVSKKPSSSTEGVAVIRSSAVRSMSIDFDDARYFDANESLNPRDFISKGDLLFTRLSGSPEFVGVCALAKKQPNRPTQYPDRLFCGQLINAENGPYLELFFSSREYLNYIKNNIKSSAGHQRITTETIKNTKIPLPSLQEQNEIVRRVGQFFAFADQLETKVASAKSRVDLLTQSILAKAFRGELVSQDPNEEPARVLLQRIKDQRVAALKVKRSRKASA